VNFYHGKVLETQDYLCARYLATGVLKGSQVIYQIKFVFFLSYRDTAGQERFRTITSTYYRGTHGVIVVYDVTNASTFKSIQRWLLEIEQYCSSVSRILVGNKNDDETKKVVSTADARNLANSYDIDLVETSAKDDINVEDVFYKITKSMLRMKRQQQQTEKRVKESQSSIRLQNPLNKAGRRKLKC